MTRGSVLGALLIGFVLTACNVKPIHVSAMRSFKSGGLVLRGLL
jgi:hypothetical protein